MGTDQFITDKPQTVQHFGLNIGRVHLCIVFIQQAFRGILPCPLAPFAGGRMRWKETVKHLQKIHFVVAQVGHELANSGPSAAKLDTRRYFSVVDKTHSALSMLHCSFLFLESCGRDFNETSRNDTSRHPRGVGPGQCQSRNCRSAGRGGKRFRELRPIENGGVV